MTLTVQEKEYKIKEINWKQSRHLHHLHTQAYFASSISDGKVDDLKIDFDKFYEAMEYAIDVAFDNPEESLKDLNHAQIDEVGQRILTEYLNPVKKNGSSD
jgi:hypothetical protein|tara:strand:- start:437 stop:739 length:303 start_codon:yes stop_codon:yes gene_type:complete